MAASAASTLTDRYVTVDAVHGGELNVGVQADIYQQNGDSPTITVQSTFTRVVPQSPTATTSNTTVVEPTMRSTKMRRGFLGGSR